MNGEEELELRIQAAVQSQLGQTLEFTHKYIFPTLVGILSVGFGATGWFMSNSYAQLQDIRDASLRSTASLEEVHRRLQKVEEKQELLAPITELDKLRQECPR